ncbi:MAG: peptidase [Gammaproteobacteria bacterium RIFCSPHIGHO2_12_FULL_41_15]|nr:MAG: peptidase [Gammaproteobacteria bacterium RIFCSPHIGHO2_12_FULL_41_15]
MGFLKRVTRHGMWGILSLGLTFAIILGVFFIVLYSQLPDTTRLKTVRLQVPLKIYTEDGKLIAVYGSKWRTPTTLDKIPKDLINAILATEDQRFYEHPGVDPIGLIRAAKSVILNGRKTQGASTITMQVARNFFLSRKKTYDRKLREILLAIKIDQELSKDKILELYLNKVFFGKRAYGIVAAAQVYYGLKPDQLTLPQMAMLAGLPQSPSVNNPINDPAGAKERRNHVLARMLDAKFITQAQYETAIQAPITASYHQQPIDLPAPYVAEMVRQAMVQEYGNLAYEHGFNVYTTLNSTMQIAAQQAVQQGLLDYTNRHGYWGPIQNLGDTEAITLTALKNKLADIQSPANNMHAGAVTQINDQSFTATLANGQEITIPWEGMRWARRRLTPRLMGPDPKTASDIVARGDIVWLWEYEPNQWRLTQIPKAQAALVSLQPKTGAIKAMVGGFNYSLSAFNRATQAERQPGSNIKPFIYSAALNKGFTLASTINDAPLVLKDTGENQLWRPRNDSKQFYGPTRLATGLIESRNLVSIRLLQSIGIPYTLTYIQRFGFDPAEQPHTLSLALGSGTTTPLQLATGFAVFANGGYRVTPYFIDKIEDLDGQMVSRSNPAIACDACITDPNLPDDAKPKLMAQPVISPQNAYLITKAMKSVIQEGTGRAANVLNRNDIAGKTGTTNKQLDAWFSGFNNNLVTTVWVGFDNMNSVNEYGNQAALPIWLSYMANVLKNAPEASMPEPPGLITLRIDKETGLLANSNNPNSMFELFRKEYAPKSFTTTVTNFYSTQAAQSKTSSEQAKPDNHHNDSAAENLF